MASAFMASLIQYLLFIIFSFSYVAWAYDPEPLQDFCVADVTANPSVNGYPCKPSSSVTADDFVYKGFVPPLSTANALGLGAVFGVVEAFPALNTLGLSLVKVDMAPGGLVPPHVHPRASELFQVNKGRVYAGFVTTGGKLIAKMLHKGEVMAFPKGLVHFQANAGNGTASGIASLSSQSPGFQLVANALLGSGIPDSVLTKTFLADAGAIDKLKAPFLPKS